MGDNQSYYYLSVYVCQYHYIPLLLKNRVLTLIELKVYNLHCTNSPHSICLRREPVWGDDQSPRPRSVQSIINRILLMVDDWGILLLFDVWSRI